MGVACSRLCVVLRTARSMCGVGWGVRGSRADNALCWQRLEGYRGAVACRQLCGGASTFCVDFLVLAQGVPQRMHTAAVCL